MKRISIITPSYNQVEFIESTILSVLNQNYPNLEYIIIDGGSTDGSIEIIKKYEKYLSYWISEKDKGQTHAINKGLKKSTGEIIAYLNSDDLYLPDTLTRVNDYFIKNPSNHFVYGDLIVINEKNQISKYKRQPKYCYSTACFLGFGKIIDQPTCFWSRDIFNEIGYFDESYDFCMDSEYWGRIAQKYELFHINEFFSFFRMHSHSKTYKIISQGIDKNKLEKKKLRLVNFNQSRYANIPYKMVNLIKLLYQIKRIIIRFFSNHYFK